MTFPNTYVYANLERCADHAPLNHRPNTGENACAVKPVRQPASGIAPPRSLSGSLVNRAPATPHQVWTAPSGARPCS
jgi:hypothetical protein